MNSDCGDHLDLKSRSGRLEIRMRLSDFKSRCLFSAEICAS